jgi:hypothetical protein
MLHLERPPFIRAVNVRNIRDPAYRRRSFLSNLKLIHYRNGSLIILSSSSIVQSYPILNSEQLLKYYGILLLGSKGSLGSVLCKKQDLSGITASIGGGTITQIRGE